MIPSSKRWLSIAVFFLFMLLHQTDRLLIGPLASSIMADFDLNEVQMGAMITASLILSSIFYPIWGFLYDRYARPRLLALASLVWGLTTWLSAIAPTPGFFLVARAATGIDDSSYPGIGSLVSDYFPPQKRSSVFGVLQLSIPLGYLLGLILALYFSPQYGWRKLYVFTAILGIFLAIVIYFGVSDIPRGASEPELMANPEFQSHKLQLRELPKLFQIRSLRFLFLQGFIGVLPWQVITFWSFRYLEIERGYSNQTISSIMIPAVLLIGAGYFFGGFIGDAAFKRHISGRLIVSAISIIIGAVMITLTLNLPTANIRAFRVMMAVSSFFIPIASPNIATSVYDVVLPEIRSSATSVQYFLGNLGSAFAPLLAGAISTAFSLKHALIGISLVAWALTALILGVGIYFFPADVQKMRAELSKRSAES